MSAALAALPVAVCEAKKNTASKVLDPMKKLLVLALLAALLPAPSAMARLYKWVDADGKVHYSDRVPPEAVSHGREELSQHGMTVNTVAKPKSAEQLEAERRAHAAAEAERQAREQTERKQAEQDRILRLTYTSVEEIERARDDRLSTTEARIRLTQERLAKLQEQIEKAQRQAAQAERSGRPTTEHHARIGKLREQIDGHESFIQERQQERAATEAKFNADIERFRELQAFPGEE